MPHLVKNLSVKNFFNSSLVFWLLIGALMSYLLTPIMKKLNFGIDLVGGTYVTLTVETDSLLEKELQGKVFFLITKLTESNILFSNEFSNKKYVLSFKDQNSVSKAKEILEKLQTDLSFTVTGLSIEIFMPDSLANKIKENAIDSNIEVLRNRLNAIGVEEVSVGKEGDSAIVVELPNVQDPLQAKAMIGTPAVLEFIIVEAMARNKAELLDKYDGEIPFNMFIAKGESNQPNNEIFYLLDGSNKISGAGLLHAVVNRDSSNLQYGIDFQFDAEGANKFHELTGKNIGRNLAIVLDEKVISSPRINDQIGARGRITGNFDEKGGKNLALMLRSGAFSAPLKFEEERTIGPSLGQESIRYGLFSCISSLVLLFIFSLFYYKLAGFFAFLALVFNLLMILFFLSRLGAALTLPGIAGMVLTVGMAIDASILIFESMREINKTGVSAQHVVQKGFSDALTVILDANITTLIAGVVLFKFGTGPVRGFAITMMLGILSTLISGLFFLKSLFTTYVDNGKINNIKI
jgi:preprotein translocase subunit SecD